MGLRHASKYWAYHGALKWWLKHDSRGAKGWQVDWLAWQMTNPMFLHYFYVQKAKRNGFVVNANVHKIVENGTFRAHVITKSILSALSTSDGQPWFVMSTKSFIC